VVGLACSAAWAGDVPANTPAADNVTAAQKSVGTTKRVILKEDPNLRILGMSPRQMLHAGIAAIVLFNIVGGFVLWRVVRRSSEQEDAAG